MTHNLGEKQLKEEKLKCNDEIKKLQKTVNYGKAECNKKTADLDNDCSNITNLQKTIKQRV